jgi:hypothetical protein
MALVIVPLIDEAETLPPVMVGFDIETFEILSMRFVCDIWFWSARSCRRSAGSAPSSPSWRSDGKISSIRWTMPTSASSLD